jgi:hypothetical protein
MIMLIMPGHWRTSITAGHEVADQPSENRSTLDPLAVETQDGMVGAGGRRWQRSMWPLAVVVGAVPGKDSLQMSLAEDQDAVCELGSGGRCGDDGAGGGGELGVAIADEGPEPLTGVVEAHGQVDPFCAHLRSQQTRDTKHDKTIEVRSHE